MKAYSFIVIIFNIVGSYCYICPICYEEYLVSWNQRSCVHSFCFSCTRMYNFLAGVSLLFICLGSNTVFKTNELCWSVFLLFSLIVRKLCSSMMQSSQTIEFEIGQTGRQVSFHFRHSFSIKTIYLMSKLFLYLNWQDIVDSTKTVSKAK